MAGLADYPHVLDIPTRWKDNDVYGHVNNVEYYSYFDTVINRWLITEGGLDIHDGEVIGLCVESHCAFKAAMAFPDLVRAGLRVAHLGRSSVRYEIGLFREDDPEPAAEGWFVHVFVDRAERRPRDIPERVRAALERLAEPGQRRERAVDELGELGPLGVLRPLAYGGHERADAGGGEHAGLVVVGVAEAGGEHRLGGALVVDDAGTQGGRGLDQLRTGEDRVAVALVDRGEAGHDRGRGRARPGGSPAGRARISSAIIGS